MAGLQNCCRKLLIYNTSRLINRNGTLLQPSRRRHHLVFQISSPQSRLVFQKSKLLFSADRQQFIVRSLSTNDSIPRETVTTTPQFEISKTVSSVNEAGVTQPSNMNVVIDESALPPAPLGEINEVPVMEFISTGLKEPSFESLGLGSWWPSGIIQQLYEYLHINLDLPWWQSIILVTVVSRLLLFPVNLSVRKDSITMMNHLPEMAKYQQKITEAKMSGDPYAVANATQEMQMFMQEKKINVMPFFKAMFIQAPVFISMYYALRGMANAPVESMKTGGLLWFTDFTAVDSYYILPILLSVSLFLVIELGAEATPPTATRTHTVRWVMRGMPVVICFISTKFPSCITLYWTVSNLIVLCQSGLFKIPAVARYFNLPKVIKHNPSKTSLTQKGFLEGFKEGYANAKIMGQLKDRERLSAMQFQKAGSGAIPRTFKKNPLLEKEKK